MEAATNLRIMWLIVTIAFFNPARLYSQISAAATAGIQTEIVGDIQVELSGHWLHQGSLIPGKSQFRLIGALDQQLQQINGAFYELTEDKISGEVILGSDINLRSHQLQIISGAMQLNSYHFYLDSVAHMSEQPFQTVRGASGYISTSRRMSSPVANNVAGMGLSLTVNGMDSLGYTEFRRGHSSQLAAMGLLGIERYYDFYSENPVLLPMQIDFRYDESELNGNSESELELYVSSDHGLIWHKMASVLDTINNQVTALVPGHCNRFTLSSSRIINQKQLLEAKTEGYCELQLSNWPNPFSRKTTVHFFLPQASYIQLSMFDMVGKKVKYLLDGNYAAGHHRLDVDREGQAEGIYFFSLLSNCGRISHRAILN